MIGAMPARFGPRLLVKLTYDLVLPNESAIASGVMNRF